MALNMCISHNFNEMKEMMDEFITIQDETIAGLYHLGIKGMINMNDIEINERDQCNFVKIVKSREISSILFNSTSHKHTFFRKRNYRHLFLILLDLKKQMEILRSQLTDTLSQA